MLSLGGNMVSSLAKDVKQYVHELSDERQSEIQVLINLIRENLEPGHIEGMTYGMIGWQVPLVISGPTYNGQPLAPVSLAVQKHHISIYLMGIYASDELTEEFQKRWTKSGKRPDMGKACIRIKTIEDADLETIAWAVGVLTPQEFSEMYLTARSDYLSKKRQ